MGGVPGGDGLLVAVTESHPLPGVDFDTSVREGVIEALPSSGGRVLVVALRDPYDLDELQDAADYLCTFGPRWCSAEAAAAVLFGEVQPGSGSPVSVPGTDILAE